VWGSVHVRGIAIPPFWPKLSKTQFTYVAMMLQIQHIWIDSLCIYVYRRWKKPLRNLRFGPPFSEGFLFPSRISKPFLSAFASPYLILCLYPCILALKCMDFTLSQPHPESKMKLFPTITIPLASHNHRWPQSGAADQPRWKWKGKNLLRLP